MNTGITITPVRGKAAKRAYRNDPNWVAPLYIERFEHLDPKKNPYFQHADVELFLAARNGKTVGRISAQVCRLRSEIYKDGVGQFGFIEAEDDPAIFAALFEAASGWLKSRGISRIQGPFNFSINDEMGLLIKGFDTPPNLFMGHALPYYAARIEEQGFAKVKDVFAYDYVDGTGMTRAMNLAHQKAMSSKAIRIRPLDKKHLMRDLDVIVSILNDGWSDNWGFVPWTKEEIVALGNNLKMLVTGQYIAIAELHGEAVAMAVSLPNVNEWITGLNGRLLPFGWAKLAWNLLARPPNSIRIPLMGLRKAYHGTPLGATLALGVIGEVRRYHVSRGTKRGELSWILEDNMPMRRMIEIVGGRAYKTYRVYERPVF